MRKEQDTAIEALMEQLIAGGSEDMASVFAGLFDLAMRIECERYLGAGHHERRAGCRGYANGTKPKRIDTPAGTAERDKALEMVDTYRPMDQPGGQRRITLGGDKGYDVMGFIDDLRIPRALPGPPSPG